MKLGKILSSVMLQMKFVMHKQEDVRTKSMKIILIHLTQAKTTMTIHRNVLTANSNVSETNLKDLKPVRVTYLFQWVGSDDIAYLVSMDRDFNTGRTSEIEKGTTSSPWEDTKIGNFDGVISLEKALELLKASKYSPATSYATLRKPVIPRTTLRYMFGENVYVDAMTGEVFGPSM